MKRISERLFIQVAATNHECRRARLNFWQWGAPAPSRATVDALVNRTRARHRACFNARWRALFRLRGAAGTHARRGRSPNQGDPWRRVSRFLLALVFMVAGLGAASAATRPNIIFVLTDDFGWGDLGSYGGKFVPTPNLDRMANEGVRFTQFYVAAPICSPSRVACTTGMFPTRWRITSYLQDRRGNAACEQADFLDPQAPSKLAAAGLTFDRAFAPSPSCAPSRGSMLTGLMPARSGAEPNHAKPRGEIKKLPAYLKELGYEVVAFGKVAHYEQVASYGFDHYERFRYHEDIAIPAALEWLRNRQSTKPLALFVGCNWPHVPWPQTGEGHNPDDITVPDNHEDTPPTRAWRSRYYAAIGRMDADLGLVYQLAQDKFGANLFFLHFSDQGAQWPFGKWCLYDDGIRTPMIAVWPGHIAPGTRTAAMVSLVDVLPTLVAVAGGKAPESLDGRSFENVLLGQTNGFRDYIFSTHSGDGNMNVYPSRCVRDERWKFILNLHPEFKFTSHITETVGEDGNYWRSWMNKAKTDTNAATLVRRYQERPREELYDLVEDPLERHNLAGSPACVETLAKMRLRLSDWMRQQGDQSKVYGTPRMLNSPPARPVDDPGAEIFSK